MYEPKLTLQTKRRGTVSGPSLCTKTILMDAFHSSSWHKLHALCQTGQTKYPSHLASTGQHIR